MTRNPLREAIGSRLNFTFDCMDVAGPLADRLEMDSWQAFVPTEPLCAVGSMVLYEAHCREIAARVRAGKDTRPGTWAEIAAEFHLVSLKAPLRQAGAAVYAEAMKRCWPAKAVKLGLSEFREVHPGQVAEDAADLRRRLARPDRAYPAPKKRAKKKGA